MVTVSVFERVDEVGKAARPRAAIARPRTVVLFFVSCILKTTGFHRRAVMSSKIHPLH